MIFDEAYRKAGRIGHATADWDVSHGNRYDWGSVEDTCKMSSQTDFFGADPFSEAADKAA
jgi:hypothetical protein